MLRTALTAAMALLLTAGMAFAADKEVKGTIVKLDVAGKKITLKTGEGEKVYDVSADTKFIGPKGGVSDQGIKDSRLTKGLAVTAKVAANNRTLREVNLPTTVAADPKVAAPTKTPDPKKPADPKKTADTKKAAEPKKAPEAPKKVAEAPKKTAETPKKAAEAPKKPVDPPKVADATKTPPKKAAEPAKTPAPPKTEAPKVAATKKPAAKKVDKPLKDLPKNVVIGTTAADAPGTKAKIVKVDVEKKTIAVTMQDGKAAVIQTNDDTQFIGPRGGISDYRLKDDRLAVGYEIKVVAGAGNVAKEIHMSYRPRKATDK